METETPSSSVMHLPEITWSIQDERGWQCVCGESGTWFSGPDRFAMATREAIQHILTYAPPLPEPPVADPEEQTVVVLKSEWESLLAVGTLYVDSFGPDEMVTFPERFFLQGIEEIVEKHGKRY